MGKSTKRSAQPIVIPAFTEAEFMQQIIRAARLQGWLVFHTYDSRMATGTGYPDLTLAHPTGGFFLAEIKGDEGTLRPEQKQWITTLRVNGIETHVWRPSDIDAIIARLQVA